MKVIVTGASSGLGLELARHYLGQGAIVGLIARNMEPLQQLVEEWPEKAVPYCADVRITSAMQHMAQDFTSRFGCPDLVIANAGISIGNLTEYADDIDVFQAIFDTNLLGMLKTFQPFVSGMKRSGHGTLAGVASVAGVRGLPGAGAYSASKAAVMTYLEALRVELAGSGVKVITLCPGYIETAMTRHNPYPMPFIMRADQAARKMAKAIAAGREIYVLPWQMAVVAKLLRWMPSRLYRRLFSRAPHKPRLQKNPDASNSSASAK